MEYTIELIVDFACQVGENPIWHSDDQALYWLDIPAGQIFRYDPQSERADRIFKGDVIGGMTIQQNGDLLLFMEAGRIALLSDGGLITVNEKIAGMSNGRFNDVIASPSGNVFCGTLSYDGSGAALYRLNRDRTLEKVIHDVGLANGLGFSPNLDFFYFTDSNPARKIYRYDYNRDDDTFHEQTVFSHLTQESGLPDGLVVDAEGYIWSARWGAGKVIRFAPSGDIDLEIEIPDAKQVASLNFGGTDYSDLYVTTAGGQKKSQNGENAGALFRIQFDNLRGLPEYRSRIEIEH